MALGSRMAGGGNSLMRFISFLLRPKVFVALWALLCLAIVCARSQAADTLIVERASGFTASGEYWKLLNNRLTHRLSQDFAWDRSAPGTLLQVRCFHKDAQKWTAVEQWCHARARKISSWKDLQIKVSNSEVFCGGQEPSYIVVISDLKKNEPMKTYAIQAKDLKNSKEDFMDSEQCME